jgi:hypothetical protein
MEGLIVLTPQIPKFPNSQISKAKINLIFGGVWERGDREEDRYFYLY